MLLPLHPVSCLPTVDKAFHCPSSCLFLTSGCGLDGLYFPFRTLFTQRGGAVPIRILNTKQFFCSGSAIRFYFITAYSP